MRKLKVDEIECRVAQVTAKGCSLLLYKTARVDRAILDETVGPMNWQNDFKIIDGKMYGYVSIWDDEKKQWITKCDCGVESNTEAEKGQASDCFKRAGFKWGIGIELYSAPFIFIQCETVKDGNKYKLVNPYIKYQVQEIGYADNGDINRLKIIDDKKNVVYELGKHFAPKKKEEPKEKFIPDVIKNKEQKEAVSAKDKEFYDVVSSLDDIKDVKEYYEQTKENLENRPAYHKFICARIVELKEKK